MNNLSPINKVRRSITRFLTRNIGKSRIMHSGNPKIKRVLICRPNARLGNLLLVTPLVQEIIAAYPDCKIDFFVKGNLAPIIFGHYENTERIIKLPKKPFSDLIEYFKVWWSLTEKQYDLVINIDNESSSGRLSAVVANSKYKIFGGESYPQFQDEVHLAKRAVYNFREFKGNLKNRTPIAPISIKLTAQEISNGRKLLEAMTDASKKTIALFTFATGSKMYAADWWRQMYNRLVNEFPNHNIIEILPIENVSQLDFIAPTFYSKDIREIAGFMANTDVFVGADSGMMHLASAAQIPVVGLFAVTDINKYQPYGNNSIGINTHLTTIEETVAIIGNLVADYTSQKVISINRNTELPDAYIGMKTLKKGNWYN